MEYRPFQRDQLNRENGADAQRLLPWSELNAPFEGSWCVVPPGGATGTHAHHEYEIFIALTGEAEVESEGDRRPFRAGDVVHFLPHAGHRVINEGDKEFQFYCVWWDTDMTERFTDRHEARA